MGEIMEHLESNEEARYMVDEANRNIKEMGELLDAEGEQEILDCEQEEIEFNPEYQHLNPDELNLKNKVPSYERVYRPIKVDPLPELKEKQGTLIFTKEKLLK